MESVLDWQFIETIDEHEGQFLYAQDLGNDQWRYGVGYAFPNGQWQDMATGAGVEGVTHWAKITAPEMRPFPYGNGPSERRTV
jgi:hypothetical protein